ncbi:hypothetical protein J6590_064757 [Homalodisca vitripennis]|nr:hypothetical protein J6590_064757 [Homalodisca vitripennis]
MFSGHTQPCAAGVSIDLQALGVGKNSTALIDYTEDDFHLVLPNTTKKRLKNEAIPTLFDFPSNIQPPPKKQRRVVIKKKLPVPIQPPSADLRFEANTSMSSVLLLPLEHDQSVSTPNEQKSTVGLHQTPKLRSGSKGQPVPLSAEDKRKTDRSLSTPESSASPESSTPVKTTKMPTEVEACVDAYLSGEAFIKTLVDRLPEAMKPMIAEAVRAALVPVNAELTDLRKEVASLRERVNTMNEMEDRVYELEQYGRRTNLRIFGVEETVGENTDEKVMKLCHEHLCVSLPLEAISRSHRIGKKVTAEETGPPRNCPLYQLPRPAAGIQRKKTVKEHGGDDVRAPHQAPTPAVLPSCGTTRGEAHLDV